MDRTREFIRQAQEGNQEAKEILLQENTGLIWNIVKRFYGRGYDPEDLYQIGAIGLLKCIDNFDFTYDVKFSTYAVPMIMGEIRRFCRDDGMLKVSRTLKSLAAQAAQMREKMTKDLGRDITLQELADGLGITLEELLPALEATKDVESLSASLFEGENGKKTELEDRLGKGEEEQIVDRLFLEEALNTLPQRERQILMLRYFGDLTQSQIAVRLGISQVQVSRIEKRVLSQMREKYGNQRG